MTKYEEAKKMLQELYNDGMGESDLYKGLNEFIAKFDTKVTDSCGIINIALWLLL